MKKLQQASTQNGTKFTPSDYEKMLDELIAHFDNISELASLKKVVEVENGDIIIALKAKKKIAGNGYIMYANIRYNNCDTFIGCFDYWNDLARDIDCFVMGYNARH